jgi:hypothetical protein
MVRGQHMQHAHALTYNSITKSDDNGFDSSFLIHFFCDSVHWYCNGKTEQTVDTHPSFPPHWRTCITIPDHSLLTYHSIFCFPAPCERIMRSDLLAISIAISIGQQHLFWSFLILVFSFRKQHNTDNNGIPPTTQCQFNINTLSFNHTTTVPRCSTHNYPRLHPSDDARNDQSDPNCRPSLYTNFSRVLVAKRFKTT